jgi:hypothetical protein
MALVSMTISLRIQIGVVCFATGFLLLALSGNTALAAEPRIDRIELFGTNQVTIHFDTEANLTYTLQYLDLLPAGTSDGNAAVPITKWTTLTVMPSIPFFNHYIIVDTRTSSFRVYRLLISP